MRFTKKLQTAAHLLLCAVALTACRNGAEADRPAARAERSEAPNPSAGAETARVSSAAGPALELARQTTIGTGLGRFANQVARSTVTYAALARNQGAEEAQRIVESEIAKALPTYEPEWQQKLAAIYAGHLSQEELRSLASLGPKSPYAGKFSAVGSAVAREMKQTSSGVLEKLVTQALRRAAAYPSKNV